MQPSTPEHAPQCFAAMEQAEDVAKRQVGIECDRIEQILDGGIGDIGLIGAAVARMRFMPDQRRTGVQEQGIQHTLTASPVCESRIPSLSVSNGFRFDVFNTGGHRWGSLGAAGDQPRFSEFHAQICASEVYGATTNFAAKQKSHLAVASLYRIGGGWMTVQFRLPPLNSNAADWRESAREPQTSGLATIGMLLQPLSPEGG